MKTQTRRPKKALFENQRDITNHGQTTHETKHDIDFGEQGVDMNENTTHEIRHEDDFREPKPLPTMRRQPMKRNTTTIFPGPKNRYKWEENLPTKIDTKTTSEIQRHITNDGKTLHETNPENDFSRDKESIRLKGQPTRTDPKTPFENHKEITTHGKTTHETKHENDFSRDTGSTRLKGQPTKTDTKTTFEL